MWQGQGMMDGWFGWGGMFVGPLFMILILVLFIYLIVALVRKLSGGSSDTPRGAPPENPGLAILQERFARGEIDADEYEQRRAILQEKPK